MHVLPAKHNPYNNYPLLNTALLFASEFYRWLHMRRLYSYYDYLDLRITRAMAHYGVPFLRIALGIVFFWFGVLK